MECVARPADRAVRQRSQLTGGHGVYLVFWFGDGKVPPPPQGRRPTGPDELRQRLEEQLTESERRRITVRVIDVSPVGKGRSS